MTCTIEKINERLYQRKSVKVIAQELGVHPTTVYRTMWGRRTAKKLNTNINDKEE